VLRQGTIAEKVSGKLHPYKGYVREAYLTRAVSCGVIYKEIKALGFGGACAALAAHVKKLRKKLIQDKLIQEGQCRIRSCKNASCIKDLCEEHYRQWRASGRLPKKPHPVSLNEIHLKDGYAELQINVLRSKKTIIALIDLEDVEAVKKFVWHWNRNAIQTMCNGKTTALSAYLLKPRQGQVAIYKNSDVRDNRRANLALGTVQQRVINSRLPRTNTSGYKGVYKLPNNKWVVRLIYNGKAYGGGTHPTIEDAIMARKNLEKKYYAPLAIQG